MRVPDFAIKLVLSLGLCGLFCLGPAFAETGRRVALIIGNGHYQHVRPLDNPANDAAAMDKLLKAAGFTSVEVRVDLDQRALLHALADFEVLARDAEVTIVYYSGHGLEFGGQNYLVPVDAAVERDVDVRIETVPLDLVLEAVAGASRLKLVILDACRTDPFKATSRDRAVDRGLRRIEPSEANELVAYSAKAGTVAKDGEAGGNSPYTAALLKRLTVPGLDVELALRHVRDDVLDATHRVQEPFYYGAMSGEEMPLVARPADQAAPPPVPLPAPVPAPPSADAEGQAFAAAMRQQGLAGLDAFLTLYPTSGFADIIRGERARRVAVLQPAPSPAPVPQARACNGVTQASLRERAVGPLTPDEVCALQPKGAFKECDHCPTMVLVPSGSFTMGSPASEPERSDEEGPQHKVTFAEPFAVGKFAVTFDEWDACVADGGCNGYKPGDEGWGRGKRPVINVSWDNAQAYVAWLGHKTQKPYRLLSESEWEYAARAGTTTIFWWGNSISTDKANYDGASTYNGGPKGQNRQKTLPVDSFKPNPFGLYNMLGNVWQWVQDCYQDNYTGAPDDGSVVTTQDCKYRVLRGGSWYGDPRYLRAASRYGVRPGYRNELNGFRVALGFPRTQ